MERPTSTNTASECLTTEEELNLLRNGSYYAFGIPHRQADHKAHFNKTLDALRLIRHLMQTGDAGTCLLVANPPTLERSPQEARLIGLTDLAFCEGIQDVVLSEAKSEAKPVQRLPVMLMSDFESLPGFIDKKAAVEELFNRHTAFREAAYSCVPSQLRPRKHHSKTFAQLEALDNKEHAKEARARIDYVLYQISMVLFIGGKKLGHTHEQPYDQATQMAETLLASTDERAVQFDTIVIPEATGEVPYRAAKEMDSQKIPDLISAYGLASKYDDLMTAFVADERRNVDGVNNILRHYEKNGNEQGRLELLNLVKHTLVQFAIKLLAAHQRFSEPNESFIDFVSELKQRVLFHIQRHPKIKIAESRSLTDAYINQYKQEGMLAATTGRQVFERMLFTRSGLMAVLERSAVDSTLQSTAGRWLPFHAEPPSNHTYYDYVTVVGSGLMWGKGAPFENPANLMGLDSIVAQTAWWTMPSSQFQAMLFTPRERNKEITCSTDIDEAVEALVNNPERERWKIFDAFLDAIEDTPLEEFYQAWLAMIQRKAVPPLEPLTDEFLRSPEALRARELLAHPYFSEHFRKDFIHILNGH